LQDTYEGRLSSEVLFDASSIAPDDDKHVWFSQVDTTGDNAFHDLVGNVAEWVTEKNVTDKSVTGKNAVGIVGGSALSSPSSKITRASRRCRNRIQRHIPTLDFAWHWTKPFR
jgi:hypothetical protein